MEVSKEVHKEVPLPHVEHNIPQASVESNAKDQDVVMEEQVFIEQPLI